MNRRRNYHDNVVVVLALVVVITALLFIAPSLAAWIRQYELARQQAESKDLMTEKERAAAYDNMGGKTPEETLDLFLISLKENNTFKASQYYRALFQFDPLSRLQGELAKNGNLNKSIKFFTQIRTKGVKECNGKIGECVFGFDGKTVKLVRNNTSGVWKIDR